MEQVLLVEDDQTIRLTVEYALSKAGYAITACADGPDALAALSQGSFGVVLLDLMLPRMGGLEVTRTLRARGDRTPIIMLTALSEERDKVRGLDAGADDYVTKPFSMQELLARVRANMRRGEGSWQAEGRQLIEAGALVIDRASMTVTSAGTRVDLRNREFELLVALACRPGALCTRQWISQTVWNERHLPTSRTIDTHVQRIRKHIDLDGWTYVQTVHGVGYRFEPRHGENRA